MRQKLKFFCVVRVLKQTPSEGTRSWLVVQILRLAVARTATIPFYLHKAIAPMVSGFRVVSTACFR